MIQQGHNPAPLPFIEAKRPDPQRLAALLARSARDNHWANNGPIVRLLEERLTQVAQLNDDQAVIACSSGTAALNLLAGLHAIKLGRPLRWAVSAFGFFSTFIGPFTNATMIDCDDQGMLDLDALAEKPSDQYDGVCVTNLFGLPHDIGPTLQFCREHNKPLIIDNAFGLMDTHRKQYANAPEIVSLHHTKPWGFGEGGCAIVHRKDEDLARSLINFGVGYESLAAPYGFNGKMSDVSAAYILDRIEQANEWAPRSAQQVTRVEQLVAKADLPLKPLTPCDTPPAGLAQAVFVAQDPIGDEQLNNPHVVLRKYYRPMTKPWPKSATDLYNHILNVPCHPGLANVADKDLIETLRQVTGSPANKA